MRCHYEVLNISRDATNDEIKKAYRKLALIWHPGMLPKCCTIIIVIQLVFWFFFKDKNADNIEEANKKFLEIQDAYETLMDSNERAWYDAHREVLLNGGLDSDKGNEHYMVNVYPYFTSSCFKGYGDDEKVRIGYLIDHLN